MEERYTVGEDGDPTPTAFRQGKRNTGYACYIIARANFCTELKG